MRDRDWSRVKVEGSHLDGNFSPIIALVIVAVTLIGLAYIGGMAFFVGLGAVALTALILVAVGAWWNRRAMLDGAQLAINSASKNDEHDASKIKALADLTREAIKARNQATASAPTAPAVGGFPALPPFGGEVVETSFTIAGLEEEPAEADGGSRDS